MNITADGNVPLSFELFDGNRTDDTTHIPNWKALRELLKKDDFIYIADCKLCSQENLDYIHEHDGKFITIVPKNRYEIKRFYKFLKTNNIEWQYAYETPNSRKQSETVIYKTYEGEPSKKMDIVSFGFTVAPKNNVTKAAEKKKSPRSIVD